MRVLHLPINIASQISVTIKALRSLGVEARGLVTEGTLSQSQEGLEYLPYSHPDQPLVTRARKRAQAADVMIRRILWADVVHWHYGFTSGLQSAILQFTRILGKPQFVEFWGSDIRIPDIEAADNPHYASVMAGHEYRQAESLDNSLRRQRIFHRAHARVLFSIGMREHLAHGLLPVRIHVPQRIDISAYRVCFPDPAMREPLIAHAPTAPILKGTAAIQEAIDRINRETSVRYDLIHGVPRPLALERMAACDIFVDQLRLGHHGLAALEAMALGKPVIAYIKPSMRRQYPPDLPIVMADPTNIASVLADLVRDGRRRRELGEAGRRYVERHHDASVLARRLCECYALARAKRC